MPDSTMSIDEWGTKRWKNSKGQLHRTDGPALCWNYGEKRWYMNGKIYRINGPAVEYANGDKGWILNDEFLGHDDEGFWALWEKLTPEQKKDPVLLSYLPEKF